ncbi:MAG: FecR domain-containing protein [Denitratisoma sp.]|nr:FecR domain-containing protein [Denitratisoma sp.]
MRRLLLACCMLFACLGAYAQGPSTSASSNLAGKVELVEGDVTVTDRARQSRRVAVGSTVFEGESIATGQDGELHVSMEDGGFIAVRPNTKMSIAAYRAEGDDKDKGVFSLLQGTFRSVTGWIGKYNPRSYQVRTPTATIGVRGTDHEPLVIPEGAKEGDPGSYDKVNVGGSYIQTRHGSIDVKPNQAGFAPLRGRPVPRILPQVPAFFKATRHEAVIAARHEAVRKVIDQRRDDRRKVLQEKKVQLDKQKADRQKAVQERKREQDAQRLKQRDERRKQQQDGQQRRQQERGLQQRDERERRSAGAEDRRQRRDGQLEMRPQEREIRGRDRDRPQRNIDRDHGPRGGGRGRD